MNFWVYEMTVDMDKFGCTLLFANMEGSSLRILLFRKK